MSGRSSTKPSRAQHPRAGSHTPTAAAGKRSPTATARRVRIAQPHAVAGQRFRARGRIAWLPPAVGVAAFALFAGFTHSNLRVAASQPAPAGTQSWLGNSSLLTVYGRAFSTAPILGRLGTYRDVRAVARGIQPELHAVRRLTGHRARIALHLIYGMATPCPSTDTCLSYVDDSNSDLVRRYILPAARRGWLVILDDQLSRSNPVSEIEHMIARGYLRYDNVEVALDPEFRTVPGQSTPGDPVGSVSAIELNAAQRVLNDYSARHHLRHRKLLFVHEYFQNMIGRRSALRFSFPRVQLVPIMDGIGAPADKTREYNSLFTGNALPAGAISGIKLFPDGPNTLPGQIDTPVLSWPQVIGRAPVDTTASTPLVLHPAPKVIVLT